MASKPVRSLEVDGNSMLAYTIDEPCRMHLNGRVIFNLWIRPVGMSAPVGIAIRTATVCLAT